MFLLLVLADDFDRSDARLFVRVGKESLSGDLVFSTPYTARVNEFVKLPFRDRYAIPVFVDDDRYRITYVEVMDVSTDTSCVYALRHGPQIDPYGVGDDDDATTLVVNAPDAEETAADVYIDPTDDVTTLKSIEDERIAEFLTDVFRLSARDDDDDDDETTTVRKVPPPPLPSPPPMGDHDALEEITATGRAVVVGVYWKNLKHWSSCVETRMTAPLKENLLPVEAMSAMPHFCKRLHMAYVSTLAASARHGAWLPDDVEGREFYPHLDLRVDDGAGLYEAVKEETMRALSMLYASRQTPFQQTAYLGRDDSAVILTRNGSCRWTEIDASTNPLSPFANAYVCWRWQLEEYVREMDRLLNTSRSSSPSSVWGKFFIRNGVVVGIRRPGDREISQYDTRPLRVLRQQFRQVARLLSQHDVDDDRRRLLAEGVDRMIADGLGDEPTFVCYYNVRNGHVYATHPLFEPGRCIAFHAGLSSREEIEIIRNGAGRAARSVAKYVVRPPPRRFDDDEN